jgi:dTDP-4-dehydrorhamnose 3,5-epimerase-like enzyme
MNTRTNHGNIILLEKYKIVYVCKCKAYYNLNQFKHILIDDPRAKCFNCQEVLRNVCIRTFKYS